MTGIKEFIKKIIPYGLLVFTNDYRRKRYLFSNVTTKKIIDADSKISLLSITKPGIKHSFFLREKSADISTYEQVFIEKEYEFNYQKIPKNIIDAGANIGLTSIYFANKFPETKIIAIEAEEKNYNLLLKNTKKYPNIICIHAALFGESGKINLLDSGLGTNAYYVSLQAKKNEFLSMIQAITINDVMETYKIEEIDVLKIDIEGAEKEVFETSASWINKVNTIIIELHERMKVGCNRNFYNNTNGFDKEWVRGECVYITKGGFITEK